MHSRVLDRVFALALYLAAALVASLFLMLLADLLRNGVAHVSWSFLVESPRDAGRAGGISTILVSTVLILAVALLAAVPIGLGTSIWLSEFSGISRAAAGAVRMSLDALAGVPSIVFGLFGNAFFCVMLGLGFSILAGGLTLACMVLPIFIRTVESGLSAAGEDWRQGGAALGMSRVAVIRHVLLPEAMPAMVAGLMLGVGRASAETAALIFTSGYVDRMPESLTDSGRALAVHIYDLGMNVAGGDANAAASAVVLVGMIVIVNAVTVVLSDRWVMARSDKS